MFHLSTLSFSASLRTLIEVLELFQNDPRFAAVDGSYVSLSQAGQPLCVTKYNGQLTVRCSGHARHLFLALLDELDGTYFRPAGQRREAWQIRRAHWKLLYSLFDLAARPLYLFSYDQVQQANADAGGRGLDLRELLEAECQRRFGFGYAGPVYDAGERNGRHEVHVGYALAAGRDVPVEVLAEYYEQPFGSDMQWAQTLLDAPELRGAIPLPKLLPLLSVLRHTGTRINSDNAALLAMVMNLAPNEPTHVEIDDLLYRHGLIAPRTLPEAYSTPVALGKPVSKFAEVLRRIMADERRETAIAQAELERAKGNMSSRTLEYHRQVAALDHGRQTYEYPNRVSAAIDSADMAFLLELLDRPDDWNRWSKKAVREVFGVKLIGAKAAARRRVIFALAGMDERQQAEWERDAATARERRLGDAAAARARERAESTRFRLDDGTVVDGAQFVEQSVAAGFTQIASTSRGASRRYSLVDPIRRLRRTLHAKDGTLQYARAVVQRSVV